MTLEQAIENRKASISVGWPAFRKEASPFVVAATIDRDDSGLPDDFVPWAPGVVVADGYLLHAAGHRFGSNSPADWIPVSPDVFTKVIHRNRLTVRRLDKLWLIERQQGEVLVHTFGSCPIATRSAVAAMHLAEYCHPKGETGHPSPRGAAATLRWVPCAPTGIYWC